MYLQDDNILALFKFKAFADDNFYVAQVVQISLTGKKTYWEKKENAGYQHFLLFPECFQKVFPSWKSKVVIVW